MAEITLADYAGYIFREIIRAREMADRHSRALAEAYAEDPVLRHFAVPRFKVPKMELTIPVLVSGARFNQVLAFRMPRDRFVAYLNGRLADAMGELRPVRPGPPVVVRPPLVAAPAEVPPGTARAKRGAKAGPTAAAAAARAPSSADLVAAFYDALVANPDPSQPATVVRDHWGAVFERALEERGLVETYKRLFPDDALFRRSLADVLATVTTNTVVDRTAIQSLLINPETNVVKNGSSEASVFTIRADMLEEGFFIRQVRDEVTGQVRPVVEFE